MREYVVTLLLNVTVRAENTDDAREEALWQAQQIDAEYVQVERVEAL